MPFNQQEFLNNIAESAKDVEYYNKEIIKIKQRDNKVSDKKQLASSSSLDLVSPCATPLTEEVVMSPTSLEVEGQEERDFSHLEYQAPTSPHDLIRPEHIKRCILQYYQNAGANKLQKHKLKIRMNCDFGDGEEAVEFIAALTQDLGNFKKYHPAESKEFIQEWTDVARSEIRQKYDVKPHLGKFHNNGGWDTKGTQFNQIEPWCACIVWYDRAARVYRALVRIYEWQELFELKSDTITDKQLKVNVKAQALWHNPLHLNIQRPKTWAEKRFGEKK